MIKFEVKNRWSGEIQFTAKIDCAEDAPRGVKLGLAVRWGVRNGADLGDANLSCANLGNANLGDANLSCANLRGANLSGANLSGARMWAATGNGREVKSLQIERYFIAYTSDRLEIGCENHAIEEWWVFDDDRITEMDDGAIEWWRKWKPVLKQIIEMSPAEKTGTQKEKQ